LHPEIQTRFAEIVRASGLRPQRALEVGGYLGRKSLLRSPELRTAERYCLNLVELRGSGPIKPVLGNANDMHMFEDESFDLVVTNATLEHDKRFWLSLGEIRRVTSPGGLVIIGVPGFTRTARSIPPHGTVTFRVHYAFDYYRFSEQAVREVFFDGMEGVEVFPVLEPPRIIGYGRKPGADSSARGLASAAGAGVHQLLEKVIPARGDR
jgi:SAM-dependent methyltransferase